MSGAPWHDWPAPEPSADFAARVAAAAQRAHVARRRARVAVIGAIGASAVAVAAMAAAFALRAGPADHRADAAATTPIARDESARVASTPFRWPTAPDWNGPTFRFPLEFAPSLPYRGGVFLHMAPDFDHPGTPDFWTYVDVWIMDGAQSADPRHLEDDLQTYYTGLCGPSSHPGTHTRAVPHESTVKLEPAPLDPRDRAMGGTSVVRGRVFAPECAATGGDLSLYVEGVAGTCAAGSSFVAYALSPRPYADPIWVPLLAERRAFRCDAR